MDSPQPKHAESTEIDLNPGIKFRKPINVELFKKELSEEESSVERPSKKGPCHEAEIFCYRRKPPAGDPTQSRVGLGGWCNKQQTINFLQEELGGSNQGEPKDSSYPSFTLIAGYGNETLKELSLDRMLFEHIMHELKLPGRVRQTILSIHGVFCTFVEDENGSGKSLLIILSTPKSPVREVFLAMRVRISPGGCSITCVLFDGEPEHLDKVIEIVNNPMTEVDWRSPIAFLILLVQDIGRTSEEERVVLDDVILNAELKTNSTSWDKKTTIIRWPADSYKTMTSLHQCHNNLVFVSRAVDMEIDIWRKLRVMERRELKSCRPSRAPAKKRTEDILNSIEFELTYTQSRKAQIQCLKERVEVQIQLIHNMMAHQESSQTGLISIIALIFAPASLIASIFSAGIFEADDRSWVAYVASTLPVTFIIVIVGLMFLEQHRVKRGWKTIRNSELLRRMTDAGIKGQRNMV